MPTIRTVKLSKEHPPLSPTPTPIAFATDEEVEETHTCAENAAKLQALANAAQNLNELSDRLTAQVSDIETTLNKLNLGVRAHVNAETSFGDSFTTHVVRLGYSKAGGKWGLIIEEFIEEDPENTYQVWPFKDGPRDLRLKVVDRIPELLDELVATSINLASEINDKIALAKRLASDFSLSSPAGSKK